MGSLGFEPRPTDYEWSLTSYCKFCQNQRLDGKSAGPRPALQDLLRVDWTTNWTRD